MSLTDAAVSKLRELTKEETNPAIGLRVYVYSGGCSGFRYGMMLEDAPTPEDKILDASGIKVYVDGHSVDLLKGSQIDYVDTLMGAGFTVNNPNAVAACGCGSSFRTADDEGAAGLRSLRPTDRDGRRRRPTRDHPKPPGDRRLRRIRRSDHRARPYLDRYCRPMGRSGPADGRLRAVPLTMPTTAVPSLSRVPLWAAFFAVGAARARRARAPRDRQHGPELLLRHHRRLGRRSSPSSGSRRTSPTGACRGC